MTVKWFESLVVVNNGLVLFSVFVIGSYNHPDIPKKKSKPVQIEIQYSPNIELYCFDIAYNLRDDDGDLTHAREFIEFFQNISAFLLLKLLDQMQLSFFGVDHIFQMAS